MVNIGPKAFIHLDRVKSNFEKIQKIVGEREILSVVKANAYGHGAAEIAKVICNFKNSKFAVFSFDEAMQLRNSDISNDIIIFSKMQPEFIDQAFKNNIIVNLSSIEDIKILKDYKLETNNCPKYHIKFDTGMTRLGIDVEDSDLLYKKIISDLAIHPEGIYTHFATADEGDISYAHAQLEKFKGAVELAEKYNIQYKYVHSSKQWGYT
jgi:Alanine racemase